MRPLVDDAALLARAPENGWAAYASVERAIAEGRNAVVYSEPFDSDGRKYLVATTATHSGVLARGSSIVTSSEESRFIETLCLCQGTVYRSPDRV